MFDGNQEELLEALKRAEETVDEMLKDGRMPEEKAWECYYSLAFECEMNGLNNYRKALHKKINWHKFDPLDAQKYPDIQPIMQKKLAKFENNFKDRLIKKEDDFDSGWDWDDSPPFKPNLN